MRRLLFTILSLALIQGTALSQQIQWQKCLGGSYFEGASDIQQTSDGGYIVAGGSSSNDGDVSGLHGNYDFWVVKLDSNTNIIWQKCLGGTVWDFAYSVQQTSDGGYIVAGETHSNNGDVSGNHGSNDLWVVKLNVIGDTLWTKCLGGTENERARYIEQTSDGGYIVAGNTDSNDGDVSGNHSNHHDFWIVKLDSSGNITWQKCLGGIDHDRASSIQQTSDGGYIVAGYTESNDGDVSGNHGDYDYWVVKLDSNGNITWQKCLGGTDYDGANSIQQTSDGGYIVAGKTESNDGDVFGNNGYYDYWVVKLDSSGNITWQKCLGGTVQESASSIQQTLDGGYIVAGETSSNDGDVSGNHGYFYFNKDYWVVKLKSSGNISWQKCLGGTDDDYAESVQQTSDGGYIVFGNTKSNDGDVSGNHGETDYWVVKLDSIITTSVIDIQNSHSSIQIYPNPTDGKFNIVTVKGELEIYNILGELIYSQKIVKEKTEVNLSHQPSGIYHVNLKTDKSIYTRKVLIQK